MSIERKEMVWWELGSLNRDSAANKKHFYEFLWCVYARRVLVCYKYWSVLRVVEILRRGYEVWRCIQN